MSEHLRHCPANVVHCGAEWNRYPIYYEKGSSARCFYSPHGLDVNNLDVALALRDQRMLTQLWTASRQMKRIMRGRFSFSNPAVPIKVSLRLFFVKKKLDIFFSSLTLEFVHFGNTPAPKVALEHNPQSNVPTLTKRVTLSLLHDW